ncbi:XRE family transcriptional regulator [Sinorhizobium sp. CCBAU 05631]|uniref:XRE family transcriptional regulator n=1 Tax=Sinorhizobium sp. CCBAU 05631 TaxID=794846 RepID=UPI001FCAF09B|nr:XRE family transcriptional regulator [Sinorhizobium sp. CCBAU 05631]
MLLKTPKRLVDILFPDRFLGEMRTPAPAECLRVARALLKLSQHDVAAGAEITRRSLAAAESNKPVFPDTNLQLVDFYVARGIEFLGETKIGRETLRAGARWAAPNDPQASQETKSSFRAEDQPLSFRAARALLEKEQADIAMEVGLPLATIQSLERGRKTADAYEKVHRWFEKAGVEFTGWGDVVTGKYYGVGVRWKTSHNEQE